MKNKESLIRLYSVYFLVLFMGLGIVVQIFYLQIFKGEQLKSDANKQIFISKKVLAPRGNIYASNEQKTSLALSREILILEIKFLTTAFLGKAW